VYCMSIEDTRSGRGRTVTENV